MCLMAEKEGIKIIIDNRSARREFELFDFFEAGLVLQGWEVKSLRDGGGHLKESYVREFNDEWFLIGAQISAYKYARLDEMNELRDKKLLLSKKEMNHLKALTERKGLTIIPLKLYFKNGLVKIEIATARGKKLHDKRQDVKKREADRAIQRELSKRS
jgi:SsrA-binding protein